MESIISKLPHRKDFIAGRGMIEVGCPWLTVDSIIFLEAVLRNDFKVFECGCGGSTIFYSKRCSSVLVLDTDEKWVQRIIDLKIENITINCLKNTKEFLDLINLQDDNYYDIISVDSNPSKTKRLDLAYAVISKVKKYGFLVLDNYNAFGLEHFVRLENSIEYIFDDPNWCGNGTKIIQIK